MFGLSAKERMAQLQAKSAKDAQPAKPPGPAGLKKVGKLNGAGSKADEAAAKAKSPDNAKELLKAKQTEKKDQTAAEEKKAKKSKSPDETKVAPPKTAQPVEDKKETEAESKAPEPIEKKEEKKETETESAPVDKKDEVAESTSPDNVEDKKETPADSKSPEQIEEKNETETASESISPEQIDEKKETAAESNKPVKVEEAKEDVKKEETPEAAPEPKPAEVESKTAEKKQEEEPEKIETEKSDAKKPEEKDKSAEKEPEKKTSPVAAEDKKEAAQAQKEEEKSPAAAAAENAPQKPTGEQVSKASDDKPKEQSKPTEKPKEEVKKPEAKVPVAAAEAKAKDTPKPKEAAAKPEAKPAEKQKDDAKKPASKAADAEAKKPEAAPQPDAKATKKAVPTTANDFKPTNDDLYSAIFYFSGMGSLLGSAMADGVYVPERSRRTALDVDEVESATKSAASTARHGEQQVVSTARSQAQVLSNDFRQLLALLENMPSFGDKTQIDAAPLLPSGASKPVDRRAVEQPIHGHVYFQQPDRPQNQQQQHGGDKQSSKVAPGYQTPTAAAVQRADNEFGQSVVQIASLQPPSSSGWNRQVAAPGAVQVLPVGSSQANYTSSVYHQPQSSKTPTFNESGEGQHHHARQPHHQPPPSQPWQERYGPDSTGRSQSAAGQRLQQQHGDVDPSGVKPWQLSHLRALEAKGYRVGPSPAPVAPSPVVYGAADDQLDGEVRSFAPYLVSDRTMNADIKQTLKRTLGTGSAAAGAGSDGYLSSGPGPSSVRGPSPYQQQQQQPRPYRPTSSTPNYPFSPAAEGALPYCDF